MQKFTIFTIILSTIIITIVTELVVQDYLQRVFGQSASVMQANTFGAENFEDFVVPTKDVNTVSPAENLIQKLKNSAATTQTTDSSSLTSKLDSLQKNDDKPLTNTNNTVNSSGLSRIDALLPALQIPELKMIQSSYQDRLFQLINTSNIDFTDTQFATLQVQDNVIASVYEFKTRTEIDAEKAFDDIRILANSFPNISSNQTNQFGDKSFYINHTVKVGEVFVVIQRDDIIYAFAYKKDYHESFKTFFGILF